MAARRLMVLMLLIGALATAQADEGGGAGEGAAPAGPAGQAGATAHGIRALPGLLARTDAADPDVRLRSRRLAKIVVAGFLRARTPPGMALIPGRIEIVERSVRIRGGFYLGLREVTVGEYVAFARAGGRSVRRWEGRDPRAAAGDVSLREAQAFAAAHGARLPTLDELEAACTGGGRFRYPWGDRFDPGRVNSKEAGRGRILPAGELAGGASPSGFLHLLGNVAEWTRTPVGSAKARRFLAVGGSYRTWVRSKRFVTYRLDRDARLPDVGFRLARSLPALPVLPAEDAGAAAESGRGSPPGAAAMR